MNRKTLKIILLIIAAVAFGISFFSFGAPFITYGSSSLNISGYQLVFDGDRYCKYSNMGNFYIFCNFFTTLVFFLISLFGFIFMFGKKKPNENLEKLTKEQKKRALIAFILFFGIFTIWVVIINLRAVDIYGYSKNSIASTGSGAISSSVFFIIGIISISICGYYNLCGNDKEEINNEIIEDALEKEDINEAKGKTENKKENLSASKTIEEQLIELKLLKDKGLISEDDYNKKKNQILGL